MKSTVIPGQDDPISGDFFGDILIDVRQSGVLLAQKSWMPPGDDVVLLTTDQARKLRDILTEKLS